MATAPAVHTEVSPELANARAICSAVQAEHKEATRAVARVYHAFRGKEKSDRFTFLATLYPAIMVNAMGAEGQRKDKVGAKKQEELARMSGLQCRSSYTRRLSRFAKLIPTARRKHEMQPMEVISRQRRFARPNKMSLRDLPERAENWIVVETESGRQVSRQFMSTARAETECKRLMDETKRPHQIEALALSSDHYHAPAIDQLAADPRTGSWWDKEFDAEGFKGIYRWIWDPRIMDPDDPSKPLGDIERMVLSAYQQYGLMDEFRDARSKVTKARGVLHIHQKKIAAFCGISLKSVYKANCKWAKLGVLRIAHDREQTEDGWTSGPQIVLYLPIRTLTEQEAATERKRFRERAAALLQRRPESATQLEKAESIHEELLAAWTGKEHTLRAFWNESDRRMLAAGIDDSMVQRLINVPRPPE